MTKYNIEPDLMEQLRFEPLTKENWDTFVWFGLLKSLERAGFEIADRTSKNRPMVRFYTDK